MRMQFAWLHDARGGNPDVVRGVSDGVTIWKTLMAAASLAAGLCVGQAAPDTAKPAPVWMDKPIPEWTESDAKQILAGSPWVKSVTPAVDTSAEKKASESSHRPHFGIGGGGFGRHKKDAEDADNGSFSSSSKSGPSVPPPPVVLTLRWESALPVREAELKARDVRAPAVDEAHYAIAIYGVPSRLVRDDSKKAVDHLKSLAAIKRTAKTDMKPSSVEIMQRDDGPVIVYLFAKSNEITWRDHQITFEAQVGNLKVSQLFAADDMRFHGALQL